MKFIIDEKIFEKYPKTKIGVIVAKNIDNNGEIAEIFDLIKKESERIQENYNSETLSQDPKIDCWRKAYSLFGVKPKEYKCSIENLYRMILKDIELRHINKLVDIYNYISIKYMYPVGGEDLDKMKGDLQLTFAGDNESEVELLGERDIKTPKPGEVIYKDDISAVCRRWNWREAARTKLTPETKNAVLVIESLMDDVDELQSALEELKELVSKYCKGDLKVEILDNNKKEIELWNKKS